MRLSSLNLVAALALSHSSDALARSLGSQKKGSKDTSRRGTCSHLPECWVQPGESTTPPPGGVTRGLFVGGMSMGKNEDDFACCASYDNYFGFDVDCIGKLHDGMAVIFPGEGLGTAYCCHNDCDEVNHCKGPTVYDAIGQDLRELQEMGEEQQHVRNLDEILVPSCEKDEYEVVTSFTSFNNGGCRMKRYCCPLKTPECPPPESFNRECLQYVDQCMSDIDCSRSKMCCLVSGCGKECMDPM
mmetsp:Transcript_8810/g.16014  ORF Transcript_8810/g.16014 Transcript_8810/m.16014 type:complete len:243 (+) Transcript_8810:477-1205(+)